MQHENDSAREFVTLEELAMELVVGGQGQGQPRLVVADGQDPAAREKKSRGSCIHGVTT